MIIVVAAGIAASTYTETQSTAVDLQSAASLRAAESGANDALMRIARNKIIPASPPTAILLTSKRMAARPEPVAPR